MSTLVCRVTSRLPVANVAMFGTLDRSSAPRMMVTLRDCLADAPTALLIDATHLVATAETALAPIAGLFRETRTWPATKFGLCGASPHVATLVSAAGPGDGWLDIYADAAEGNNAARMLPVPHRRSLELHPEPAAPARGRQFAQDICAEWSIGKIGTLVELITSELVTNAVIHARTFIDVALRLSSDILSVAVRDGDPRPMLRPPASEIDEVTTEHGRGLLLLDAMADAWGCHPTGSGKVVWACVAVAPRVR